MKVTHIDKMTDKQRKFLFRSCVMKVRYSIEPPLPSIEWRAYPCRFCDGWHLTRKRIDDAGGPHTFAVNPNWQDG